MSLAFPALDSPLLTLDSSSVLARNRTWSSTFAESRAIRHTPRTFEFHKAARRGIEPRLAESKSAVRSSTLAGRVVSSPSRNRTWSGHRPQGGRFGSCHAIQHTHGPNCQYPDLESNQDLDFRRVPCGPLHYRDERADDWIRTSMNRFTRAVPFYVEPRRQFRSRPEDRERFTSTFPIPRSSRLR